MPFGAIYGALFFSIFGFWVVASAGQSIWVQTPAIRLFLVVVCLTLALGLLSKRGWARFGGALFAAALAAATMVFARYESSVELVWMLGSLATVALLLLPATGASRDNPSDHGATPARSGGVLGWTALAASIGLLVSLSNVVPRQLAQTAEVEAGPVVLAGLSERVRWTDFGQGIARARSEDKLLLVTFVTNWCGYCSKMDRTTWKHPGVVERLGDVVAVRVDAEESSERNGHSGTRLAGQYGVQGFPTILLLDGGGQVIARTSGYQEPRQLLGWLDNAFRGVGRSASPAPMRVSGP
jgi:thioredoxin-related protein